MSTPKLPSFVWYSTPPSRAAGAVSLLAVAETAICVALYWLLWLKWGISWHHWLIVVATPLVLMRSEASVKKGVAWFDAYIHRGHQELQLRSIKTMVITAFSSILVFAAAWYLAKNWLAEFSGWALFWRSAAIELICVNIAISVVVAASAGGMIAGAVGGMIAAAVGGMFAGAVAAAVMIVILLALGVGLVAVRAEALPETVVRAARAAVATVVGVGFCVGIWLRALGIRSVATFLHPIAGLQAIPANWRRFIWQSDLLDPPELLPGHKDSGFHGFLSDYQKEVILDRTYLLLFSVGMAVFYFPGLLWRWSIKSTAWFYLPLLWVGRGWQDIQGEDLLIWAKGYSHKWLNITGVLLATFLLFVSFVALIVPNDFFDLQQTLNDAGAPLPIIGLAFVLNWQSLAAQPWQWFYLPSWMLTLMLFFLIDDHGTDIEKGAKAELLLPVLRRWMWVSNSRTALTNLGLLIALYYFLTAVDAWGQVAAFISRP